MALGIKVERENMFLDNEFYLMNKNRKILSFEIERSALDMEFREIARYEKELPIGYENIGKWLENRQAPKHRQHMAELLRKCNCYDIEGFIRGTHALSLNDTFWVKTLTELITWEDVALYTNEFDESVARFAFEGGLQGEQFTTTSPEFVTDGAYAKCWHREAEDIYLIKRGMEGGNLGLEPYSEFYASQIASKICRDYISYDLVNFQVVYKNVDFCLLLTYYYCMRRSPLTL